MSVTMVDTLVASGLTPEQAHAVVGLRVDVRCRRAFDRAIACRDLVGSGFSPEDAESAIDRTLASLRRDTSTYEEPGAQTS